LSDLPIYHQKQFAGPVKICKNYLILCRKISLLYTVKYHECFNMITEVACRQVVFGYLLRRRLTFGPTMALSGCPRGPFT